MGTASSRTPRILLVEDDADIRESLAAVLHDEGYAVVPAHDGAEALAGLRTGPLPRLVLLDLMMPGMDGWQFRALQREEPAWAAIPVIILSALGVPEFTTGLDPAAVLKKPFDVEALLHAVEICYRTPPP